jgi:hypothetical protein
MYMGFPHYHNVAPAPPPRHIADVRGQRYEDYLKEGRKMGKSLQDCRILTIFAPVNVIYSLKY